MTTQAGRAAWAAVRELFDAAVALPAGEREAFVERRAGGDAVLRDDVLSLLRAHDDDQGPIGRLDDGGARVAPTRVVGQYELIELLGIGGMGAVYLAERRKEGFTQRVALKLIRAGYVDPRLEARLVEERRILARLEHPGIARFIDGGTTESGQSYFAMELVQGTNLLQYCAERHTLLPARLALFLDVCDAVHFAHQQFVVHGDLKPENIWVTEDGRTKLLDFGIAELVEPSDSSDESPRTVPWLTPAYASPAQVCGQRLTPRDDIYALGVILYELLAGVRPYETEGLSPAELQRMICELEPPPPSRVASSPRNRRLLAGDLDIIVAKAMAKDPARRYASVEHLADDLRRFRARQPILARKDSKAYRLRKFVQRHHVAVFTGTLAILSLFTATAFSLWQAQEAENARARAVAALEQAESVSAFLISLFESNEPSRSATDTLVARAVLERGLARVDELNAEPTLQARLLDAIGDVLVSLDEIDRGRELLERSLRLRRSALGEAHPDMAVTLRSLSRAARLQARYQDATRHLEEALRIQRASLGPVHEAVAVTLSELAFLMPYLNRNYTADTLYRQALALRRQIHGDEHPAVAKAMERVGSIASRLGHYAVAESTFRSALAMNTRLFGPNHHVTAQSKLPLADVIHDQRPGHPDAEALYRSVLAVLERARGPEHLDLIYPLNNLANLLVTTGRFAEAESLHRRTLAIRRARLGAEHTALLLSEEALGLAIHRQGRFAEAESLQRSVIERRKRLNGPEHPAVGGSTLGLARLLKDRGAYLDAEPHVLEARRIWALSWGPRGALVAIAEMHLGEVLTHRGRYEEAEQLLLGAVDKLLDATTAGHRDVRDVYERLADLYRRTGRVAEEKRYRELAAGPEG